MIERLIPILLDILTLGLRRLLKHLKEQRKPDDNIKG